MSHFEVKVVKLPKFGNHPNADKLCITTLFKSFPVIFQKGLYNEGDLVAYIPTDAVVPLDRPEFEWLKPAKPEPIVLAKGESIEAVTAKIEETFEKKTLRIRAKKLRGLPSMGILIPAPVGTKEGDDIKDLLGVVKYEEPEPLSTGGDEEKDPGFAPKYNVESYRKYGAAFKSGEEVVVTEKIHGANGMFLFKNGRLWVRSHNQYKKDLDCDGNPTTSMWWVIARKNNFAGKLSNIPNLAIYGEVYGQVQDLKYGHQKGQVSFRAFDVFDTTTGRFLDYEAAREAVKRVGIEWVPELYRGPFDEKVIEPMADGKSTLADNIREGIVIKPITERFDETIGSRVILKLIGFDYESRKGGTEHH